MSQSLGGPCLILPDPVYFIVGEKCARVKYNPTRKGHSIIYHAYQYYSYLQHRSCIYFVTVTSLLLHLQFMQCLVFHDQLSSIGIGAFCVGRA